MVPSLSPSSNPNLLLFSFSGSPFFFSSLITKLIIIACEIAIDIGQYPPQSGLKKPIGTIAGTNVQEM